MNPVRLRRHGAAILAGAVGIALNLLPLPAVARLVPGRIATLPIAMLQGPWYGVAAAILATLPLARNLPLLLVVFAFEALMVGAFARRGKPPLVAGALVWSATAVTFGLFPSLFGLAYLRPSVWPIALQELLNGMISVVVGCLIGLMINYAFRQAVFKVWPSMAKKSGQKPKTVKRDSAEG